MADSRRPAEKCANTGSDVLTREPWGTTKGDVDALREEGFNEAPISDAVQVIS